MNSLTLNRLAWGLVAACVLGLLPPYAVGEDDPLAVYRFTLSEIRRCEDAVFASDGSIYALSSASHRVSVWSADGEQIRHWGEKGRGPGQFLAPRALAIDSQDRLFVLDSGNARVQCFDLEGKLLRSWGKQGSGPGEFDDPRGLTISGSALYVADAGNCRVQVFDLEGKFQREFGRAGSGAGEFLRVFAVAVADGGDIYAVDHWRHKVLVFDGEGRFQREWGYWGSPPGLLTHPTDILLRNGEVWLVDRDNHRIQMHEPDGYRLRDWGQHSIEPRDGEGAVHYPTRITLSPDGTRAIVCEPFEDRAQVFSTRKPSDPAAPPRFPAPSDTHFGPLCAVDGSYLVVDEPERRAIQFFDLSGKDPILTSRIVGYGDGAASLMEPAGLFLDARAGTVLVSDAATQRVLRYRFKRAATAPRGYDPFLFRFSRSLEFGSLPDAPPRRRLGALTRSSDGRVFVLDRKASTVCVLSPRLQFEKSWPLYLRGSKTPADFTDLTLSADEQHLLVVDSLLGRILVFALDGTLRSTWAPALGQPHGIARRPEGGYFVTDAGKHQVARLREDGTLTSIWGRPGLGPGEFFKPKGISCGPDGRVYVLDRGNHRGQIFTPEGKFIRAFGARLFVEPAHRPRKSP